MTSRRIEPSFPSLQAAIGLTLAWGASLGAACGLMSIGASGGLHAQVQEVLSIAVILWVAAIVGLVPVAMLGPWGVLPTVWGYFLGSGARALITLIGYGVLKVSGHLSSDTVVLAMVSIYVVLLFVEVGYISHYLWHKDFLDRGDTDTPVSSGGAVA